MKIARATKKDVDAIFDLLNALDTIKSGIMPDEHESSEVREVSEYDLDMALENGIQDYVSDECNYFIRQALSYLIDIHESAYTMRAAMNLAVLLDPKNEIIDAENSILEPHPKITTGLEDTTRLNWLEKQMLNDSGKEIVHDGYGFTTLENHKERKCADISETLREAIDFQMLKGEEK